MAGQGVCDLAFLAREKREIAANLIKQRQNLGRWKVHPSQVVLDVIGMSVRCHDDEVERDTVQIPALQLRGTRDCVFKELLTGFRVIYNPDQLESAVDGAPR